jgi:hypothetical protein
MSKPVLHLQVLLFVCCILATLFATSVFQLADGAGNQAKISWNQSSKTCYGYNYKVLMILSVSCLDVSVPQFFSLSKETVLTDVTVVTKVTISGALFGCCSMYPSV